MDDEVVYIENGREHLVSIGRPGANVFSETSDGSVWLGSDHGLFRLRIDAGGAHVSQFGRADGLPSDAVGRVFETPAGGRLVVTDGGFALVLDDRSRAGGLRFVFAAPIDATRQEVAVAASDASGIWLAPSYGDPFAYHYHAGPIAGYRFDSARVVAYLLSGEPPHAGDARVDDIDWTTASSSEIGMLWWRSRAAGDALRQARLSPHQLRLSA